MRRWQIELRACFVLVLLVATLGCSDGRPKRVPISGQVLIDGEPIKAGSIRFVPDGARPSASDLDAEGRFTLRCFEENDGAVIGTHRVEVAAREIIGESVRWYAPKEYSDYRSSGLTVEVKEPNDALVIDLTWKGKKKPK